VGAAFLVLLSTIPAMREPAGMRTPLGWVAALLPVAFMFVRRRFPRSVLIACVVCFAVALFTFPLVPGAPVAVTIALYTVVVGTDRRRSMWISAATAVVLLVSVALSHQDLLGPGVVLVVVFLGFADALGDAVRTRRAYIEEIMQRAIRAEQTREAEASRRVAEDRLRIARDLHDTVAHQISVISLNAGVATSALDARPEVARDALATIRTASRTVLGEIGDLLATLRMPDDGLHDAPTVGLADVEGLVDSFRSSGLEVALHRTGDIADVPPAVGVVAYRVVQEALTNALKHGSVPRAELTIERDDRGLRIEVVNPAAAPDPTTSGHGLIGMRERVDSVRGTMRTTHEHGRFLLQTDLPITPTKRHPA